MNRPFGLSLLLTIVAIWLKAQDVYSVRATALIFAKTSTTSTTTVSPEASDEASQETVTEGSSQETVTQNTTRQLTGIPQIDYIWDPNLPRELNGYNLSEYPFYDRVPEEINFKCDGLHDGFYASVPHKCQVYHHCLFGVRYDFLCANYTAFDQKTFICHFVSEVDCLNSKNFWHRNDALYQAASTTTPKPVPVYTLPPPPATSVPIVPILSRRPVRPRRPYPRRPRPYEYYDDEYEDDEYYEKPMRRQRPRYRPRVYDDEYDYEDDDYVRRPSGRRNESRRPSKPRGSNRRRPHDDEEYDDEVDDARRQDDSRRNPDEGNRRSLKRRPVEEDDYEKPANDRPRKKGHRRPIDDEYEEEPAPRRPSDRRKNKNDSRKYEDNEDETEEAPRKINSRDDRPRKPHDRKRDEDVVDDSKPRSDRERSRNEDTANSERPSRNNERSKNIEDGDKSLPKPPTSIYDRKRPALKVRAPVPAHEQTKYSPKIPKTTTPEPADEDYYYDDVPEDVNKKEGSRRTYATDNSRKAIGTTQSSAKREYQNSRKPETDEDELERVTKRARPKRPKYGEESVGNKERRNHANRRPIVTEEYEDYEESRTEKPRGNSQKLTTTVATTTTTTREPPREAVVKVLKRPFLPSRGGNPYASRGLLPVGSKALEAPAANQTQDQEPQVNAEDDKPLKQPIVVKVPGRNKYNDEDFRIIANRPATRIVKISTTPTTTTNETPKSIETDPLDLDENEYDVTLNDALNPTLPNLPVRNFPTGFSAQNDYAYNTVQQRPRYVIDPVINQASSDYVYRVEQPVSNNFRYKSVPVFQTFKQSPRVTQAIYSSY